MKAFTDLNQSKKLAEILPLESADMCWTPFDEKWDAYLGAPNPDAIKKEIPCWSLTALLGVLPYPYIDQNYKGKWTCRVEHGNTTYLWEDSNPIDACYEMILKLHELNLL